MPLGQRAGDKSDSRYCGVETDFDDDVPRVLSDNLSGGFDFLVAPLIDPSYRPSLSKRDVNGSSAIPFASSDLLLSPSQWSSHVVEKRKGGDGSPFAVVVTWIHRFPNRCVLSYASSVEPTSV